MFVFRDMDDYKARGKNVDTEYMKMMAAKKKSGNKLASKSAPVVPVTPPSPPKAEVIVPPEIVGKKVKHKSYGEGTITGIAGTIIIVSFASVGEKKLGYEVCTKNKLIEFV